VTDGHGNHRKSKRPIWVRVKHVTDYFLIRRVYLTYFLPASSKNKNESNVVSPIKPLTKETANENTVGWGNHYLSSLLWINKVRVATPLEAGYETRETRR